jgi:hypothetical protein
MILILIYIEIEIRFSCAYWLLSVICLLDSHLSKCCVSHRQQILRAFEPDDCSHYVPPRKFFHYDFTGIIPNYVIILSDISSAVGGFLQHCLPSDVRREGISACVRCYRLMRSEFIIFE